jgi:transcriptional regulator with XRE-family HTH domain
MTPDDLKQWRASLGMSQRAAAEALGVTPPTYQSWELGRNFQTGKAVEIDRRTELACKYLVEHPDELIYDK